MITPMLKTKTITTDKATLLVVELPEGGKRIAGIACDITGHFILWDDGGSYHDDNRPHGQFRIDDNPRNKWKLLGRIPDITEEQALKFVEKSKRYSDLYKSYNADDIRPYSYAIESLSSLIKANEVYFENPLGIDRPKLALDDKDYDEFGFVVGEGIEKGKIWEDKYWDWLEACKKVFDKERTFLFIKVD